MDNKPFSQACENNKLPILEVLQRHLTTPASLLEVGSGNCGERSANKAKDQPAGNRDAERTR